MSAPFTSGFLFVRILEACNAGCFMCRFARSTDSFRLDRRALAEVLARAADEGFGVVRFTGGEPLMHPSLAAFVEDAHELGLKTSVITNGYKLYRVADDLAQAGLDQVIVSIDGASPETHDAIRRTTGLFSRAIHGLRAAHRAGIRLRVNTVVGPHNYGEMPVLQCLLTELGVREWELSSLKLERPLDYSQAQIDDILETVLPALFREGPAHGLLRPLGKAWCGDTVAERQLYFQTGVTPRPVGRCHVVHHVRYYDPKEGLLYPCSLLPHRPYASEAADPIESCRTFTTRSPRMIAAAKYFEEQGPTLCTGCSTTAAGFGDLLSAHDAVKDWIY